LFDDQKMSSFPDRLFPGNRKLISGDCCIKDESLQTIKNEDWWWKHDVSPILLPDPVIENRVIKKN